MLKKIYYKIIRIFTGIKGLYYKQIFGDFGKFSTLGKHLILSSPKNIFVGKHCMVGPFCRLETYPQYGNRTSEPCLTIGDHSSLQHAVHVYCAEKVSIGKGVLIASGCMITDNDHGIDPEGDLYVHQALKAKPTTIEDYVWLGENVCVLAGASIGKRSIIGANSVVKGSIPSYTIAAGNPAKVLKKYNFETKVWERI